MDAIDPDAILPDQPHHGLTVVCVSLSIIFFVIVNEIWKYLARRYVTLAKTSQWRWRNLAVSWVHADLCAVGCFYCYFMHGHHVRSLADLIDIQPLSAYQLVTFSTGYFLYDLLDHVWNGQARAQWEVVVHHIAVIAIFGYNLLYHAYLSFSVLALSVEINSVFLHGRKLLQMLHVPFSHWFYRLTSTFNLVSFIAFRGPPMVLIWSGLIFQRHRMSVMYAAMLSTVMTFMVILNSILFWRLLKNDVLRKPRQVRKEDQDGEKREVPGSNPVRENGKHIDLDERKTVTQSERERNGCLQNRGSKCAVLSNGSENVTQKGDDYSLGRSEHKLFNGSKAL